MAIICLRYLLMEDLEHDNEDPCSSIRSFLDYSAVYWLDHKRKMSVLQEQKVTSQVRQIYDRDRKGFTLWFPIFWKTIELFRAPPSMTALHLASFNGYGREVESLLSSGGKDINSADSTGTYPIISASLNGHEKVVQFLLEKGADVNTQDGKYGNALQAASFGGYDKIVQLLLEKGADVNAQGGYYGNALQAASFMGHDKIVQLLLQKGADVNAQGGRYGNVFHATSAGRHIESFGRHDTILQLLLEKRAEANAQGGEYGNALQAASLEDTISSCSCDS